MNTYDKIYAVVCNIPPGKVATYGQVATLAGNRRWARVVGFALHVNPSPGMIPCHRVVNRHGFTSKSFAFGGDDVQEQLLKAEDIEFIEPGRVNMQKHCINL